MCCDKSLIEISNQTKYYKTVWITKDFIYFLKASKLSLNIRKTELVLLRSKKANLDHSFKIKIEGKRLIPIHSVKYLEDLLNEHVFK